MSSRIIMNNIPITFLLIFFISSPVYASANNYGVNVGETFQWNAYQSTTINNNEIEYYYKITHEIVNISEVLYIDLTLDYIDGNKTAFINDYGSEILSIKYTTSLSGIRLGFQLIEENDEIFWHELLEEHTDNQRIRESVTEQSWTYSNVIESQKEKVFLYELSAEFDELFEDGLIQVMSHIEYQMEFYKSSGVANFLRYERRSNTSIFIEEYSLIGNPILLRFQDNYKILMLIFIIYVIIISFIVWKNKKKQNLNNY